MKDKRRSQTLASRSKTPVAEPSAWARNARPRVNDRSPWVLWKERLGSPVDGSSLALFRMFVGLLMALEAYSLCHPLATTFGKVPLEVYYTGPDVKLVFPYAGFHWLPLLPPALIDTLVGLLALSGITVALGLCYRVSAAVLFLSWGYLFAVECTRTYWNSYYYSELLVSFLLIWMPAARRYSLDSFLAWKRRSFQTVPFWTILLLRGQLIVMYFYGGVAKLNADWLLDAEPVRYHLARARLTLEQGTIFSGAQLAVLKALLQSNAFAYFISYAGLIFDLSVGFLLLIRRTRLLALILLVIFHCTNHFIIFNDIDWFPLLGLSTSTIFLDPDWPDRLWRWLGRPRWSKPDWGWLVGGACLLPVVGAALGWKLPPSPSLERKSVVVGNVVALFVTVWLGWQAAMPLRHLVIPGDARFTWEGLAFSWRLKADVYRTLHADLRVDDPAILSRTREGFGQINWNNWRGDKIIYRSLSPGRINWSQLPEMMVLLEPLTGERVIYNPFAGTGAPRTESESRQRVATLWQELYGRPPEAILRTFSLQATVSACAHCLHDKGFAPKTSSEVLDLLAKLLPEEKDSALMGLLLHLTPFGIEGEPAPASDQTPFLLIHDRRIFQHADGERLRLDLALWRQGSATESTRDGATLQLGRKAPTIYMGDSADIGARDMLGQANFFDLQEAPEQLPHLSWNYMRELTVSQAMHVSTQPFLLREYARHIAYVWQKNYGRRPAVHASTAVSLNGRPFQMLVDPSADLASVPEAWFKHNTWIRDLDVARIPGGTISAAPIARSARSQ
jgi:vitamin K-dependent gamma-carboxylase